VKMNRRQFTKTLLTAGAAVLAPFNIVRAQSSKLKVGVLLPKSGLQGLIGQSCQKGADLAPLVIKERLGVDIELLNADTETNVDTARTRAEKLIQEGAQCLVGPFDSGAAAAIAQVTEQRGVPFIINIAAAPQITEQGYKYVFRNFPVATELVRNGLALTDELFKATGTTPRTAVFMHVNDTFGQANAKAIGAILPQLNLPFKLVETIAYDPAAKDLTVEVSKAKATKADFLLLVCRLNDAIALRREIVSQPRLSRHVREPVLSSPRQVIRRLHLQRPMVRSQSGFDEISRCRVQEAKSQRSIEVSCAQRRLHLRSPIDRCRCI
jgi:branched-chain amino acid transport system substrate-binding protein